MSDLVDRLREYGSDAHMVTYDKSFIVEAADTITELLEALEGMEGLLQLIVSRRDLPPDLPDALRENHRFVAARAAIARAKGTQP